jgi:hypothetical protein
MPVKLDLYKAVVRITYCSSLGNRCCSGSGVVIDPTGLVITNNHVIEDPDFGTAFGEIAVECLNSVDSPATNAVRAEVVIRNETYDLAILRMPPADKMQSIDLLSPSPITSSLMERRVRILGYPPIGGPMITVTRGIVSGFDLDGNLKTDAEINPGNSGGAALDEMDAFLGIPSFIVPDANGKLGFVITADRIRAWFQEVLRHGMPDSTQDLALAFVPDNLRFSGDNVDASNRYPRILAKFAAVETLLSEHRFEEVLPQTSYILKQRPRSPLAYHYEGNALLGLKRFLEAAERFRICLYHNPGHVPALGNLGVTLIELGRHHEALQIFEQIIDISENPVELWTSFNNIAELYLLWGRRDLSDSYRSRANDLKAAAEERHAAYGHRQAPGTKLGTRPVFTNSVHLSVERPTRSIEFQIGSRLPHKAASATMRQGDENGVPRY